MHDREKGVIGRWDNIRTENKKLIADAIFDENTPLGASVKQSVENNFLRAISVGLEVEEEQELNGVKTVLKSVLTEVSFVDIPSNPNAVKTSLKNGKKCVYLTMQKAEQQEKKTDLRTQILSLLELGENTSDADLLNAINELVKYRQGSESKTDKALRLGYIEQSQVTALRAMERYDPKAFADFLTVKQEEQKERINKIVENAISKRKVIYCERGIYDKIGLEMGADCLRKLIAVIPQIVLPTEFIKESGANRSNWGLNEYRKFAPQELKENPDLYKRLLAKESGTTAEKTLDWYRRNDPDFLLNHPQEYQRLLREERYL